MAVSAMAVSADGGFRELEPVEGTVTSHNQILGYHSWESYIQEHPVLCF